MINEIKNAMSIVFSDHKYKFIALVLSVALLLLYISIPVLAVPGNTYDFFLSQTPLIELIGIGLLSILLGILATMQIHNGFSKESGIGGVSVVGGAIPAIFSSATCVACVSAILPFLGFGSTVFLVQHRTEIITGSLILVAVALWFNIKKINQDCGC